MKISGQIHLSRRQESKSQSRRSVHHTNTIFPCFIFPSKIRTFVAPGIIRPGFCRMTANKKEELKLVCRLQAIYSRLQVINGDLIRLEAEIESPPNIDLSEAGADGAVRKIFLAILKEKLEIEKGRIEAEIESI